MDRRTVDAIDRRLLRHLQRDSRRSLRSLADELGVSAPTCLRRIRRLQAAGIIEGYGVRLDAAKLGLAVLAHVEVVLTAASGPEMRTFERRMQRCAQVLQCAELAGDVDYLLTVRTGSLQEFADFTTRELASDRGVRSFRSLLVLRQTKHEYALPL